MKVILPLAIAAALLAACNQKSDPEVVDSRAPDPNASALVNAAPVELPPAMRAQKTYRCKDNSLAYVTWFVGDKTANVRVEESAPPTVLASAEGKSPWASADGSWKLAGTDDAVTITAPGKSLSCHT